jgi:hypothetical protein
VRILINCKENAQLVTLSSDRPLSWKDRLAMRIHLLICNNCARFVRQMQLMREWLHKDEQRGELSAAARARIAANLSDAGQEPDRQ